MKSATKNPTLAWFDSSLTQKPRLTRTAGGFGCCKPDFDLTMTETAEGVPYRMFFNCSSPLCLSPNPSPSPSPSPTGRD